MFTKLKKWFRDTVADEVGKVELTVKREIQAVETSFDEEKQLLVSAISIHAKSTLNEIAREFERLLAEAAATLAAKEQHVKQLEEALAVAHAAAKKVTHWQADHETVAADHTLKVVK